MGSTSKEQRQIIAVRQIYQHCKQKPSKRRNRHGHAVRALAKMRWQELMPEAFTIGHSKAKEVNAKLGISVDSDPPHNI